MDHEECVHTRQRGLSHNIAARQHVLVLQKGLHLSIREGEETSFLSWKSSNISSPTKTLPYSVSYSTSLEYLLQLPWQSISYIPPTNRSHELAIFQPRQLLRRLGNTPLLSAHIRPGSFQLVKLHRRHGNLSRDSTLGVPLPTRRDYCWCWPKSRRLLDAAFPKEMDSMMRKSSRSRSSRSRSRSKSKSKSRWNTVICTSTIAC